MFDYELYYGRTGLSNIVNGKDVMKNHIHHFYAKDFRIIVENLNDSYDDSILDINKRNVKIDVMNVKSAKIELANNVTIYLKQKNTHPDTLVEVEIENKLDYYNKGVNV